MPQSMSRDPRAGQETRSEHTGSYPAIEALIRAGDAKAIAQDLDAAYAKLEAISLDSKGFSTASQVKKALRSIELTETLLTHLFQVKDTLVAKRHGAKPQAYPQGTSGKRI